MFHSDFSQNGSEYYMVLFDAKPELNHRSPLQSVLERKNRHRMKNNSILQSEECLQLQFVADNIELHQGQRNPKIPKMQKMQNFYAKERKVQ